MDTELQRDAEFDGFVDENVGFVDDSSYSNLFGITGGAAKRINANTDAINAETQRLREATDKKMKDIADQEKATQEAIKKAKEIKEQLQKQQEVVETQVATQQLAPPMPSEQPQGQSNTMKYVMIGGGVLLLGVVALLVLRKK